tara:strand:+ start:120 stop:341 length:222 start_codon:yes stop_codon:yes gene_type:complete
MPEDGKPYNNTSGPLTAEDKAMLDEALEAADAVKGVLQQAEMAEIDLGDLPARLKAAEEQTRRIKQAFFPGQS